MKFIELFAGIGGFRYGLEAVNGAQNRGSQASKKNGNSKGYKELKSSNAEGGQPSEYSNGRLQEQFTCVYANEFNKYAAQIYERHYGQNNRPTREKAKETDIKGHSSNTKKRNTRQPTFSCVDTRDIREVKAEEIPDHDLLTAGFPCPSFSIAGKRKGFGDERGKLFFEIIRILKDKQPRYVLLENVKGLLSSDGGRTFQEILRLLSQTGYSCQWQVLNSKDFGVPQNRERVFIIGHLRGTRRPEVFPIGQSINTGSIQGRQICKALLSNYPRNSNGNYISTDSKPEIGQAKRKYDTKRVSPPLSQNWQPIIKPEIRRLTPTECERLQGFPDGWTEGLSDTQRYKCLGNAVTVNIIRAIFQRLR